MKKTYPKNGNPICLYDKQNCNEQDMDGYTDCTNCSRYGNGVKATGGMPVLEQLYNFFKRIFKN